MRTKPLEEKSLTAASTLGDKVYASCPMLKIVVDTGSSVRQRKIDLQTKKMDSVPRPPHVCSFLYYNNSFFFPADCLLILVTPKINTDVFFECKFLIQLCGKPSPSYFACANCMHRNRCPVFRGRTDCCVTRSPFPRADHIAGCKIPQKGSQASGRRQASGRFLCSRWKDYQRTDKTHRKL